MADERDEGEQTEDPTPKRLEEAIQRGDVVKSIELSTWFMLAGGTLTLMMFAGPMAMNLQGVLRGIIANSYQIRADGPGLLDLAHSVVWRIIGALGVPFVLLTIAALGGTAIQHRILFSVEPLMPSLSKISLGAGIKRLFSVQGLVNFAK